MIELFEHNQTAYDEAMELLSATGRACVIHPTGTGKSFIAFRWAEAHPEGRFLWVSPSEHITRTQLENVKRAAGYEPANIRFMTYERLMMMSPEAVEALRPTHIVLDEFHRGGAPRWRENVDRLLAGNPRAQVLGLTATPVRYLDNQRDMARELFDNCVADQMTLGEAIARGILPAPKYVISLYSWAEELQRYGARVERVGATARRRAEEYLERLRRALEKSEGLDKVFARHMKRGRYIVFCANREHMDEMLAKSREWFAGVDGEAHIYAVWAESPTAKADYEAFRRDESEHLRLMYCIDMFNEGVHVEGLDGVVLFRPTISPIIYKQQIGRALSAMAGGTPVIFDVVNNFENLYSISTIEAEMREVVTYYRNSRREEEIEAEGFEVIDEVRECRRLFAELEETLGLSWELMYAEAKAYYEEHGHLNVPKAYRTAGNVPLGRWIVTQRRVRAGKSDGMLTEQRIAQLDRIGMEWQTRDALAWEKGYEHAAAYRAAHGNLEVPAQYACEDGYRLGAWLCGLRRRYREEPGLRAAAVWQARFRQMEALGIDWERADISDDSFERGVAEAERDYAAHGTLDVA